MNFNDIIRKLIITLTIIQSAFTLIKFIPKYEIINLSSVSLKEISRIHRDVNHKNSKTISLRFFNKTFNIHLEELKDYFEKDVFIAEINDKNSILNNDIIEIYGGYVSGSSVKSILFWEEDLVVGQIHSDNETYFLEPAWKHLDSKDRSLILVYRASDMDSDANDISSMCQEARAPDLPTQSAERTRVKRQAGDYSRCSLLLVADFTYFRNVGGGSISTTIKYMIGVVTRINEIMLNTEFSPQLTKLGLNIKGVIVHSTTGGMEYNVEKQWASNDFLNAFSRNIDANSYCLAHLFTFRNFGSILGLAWLASDKPSSLGGICSPCYSNICYNTAWSTSSLNGVRLPTLQSDLVTAHEIGHGWGSPHDPDDCAPATINGGKYLMYPYSVSGLNDNNKKFSSCSLKSIANVLNAKKNFCFTGESVAFCGNGKVESGEECEGKNMEQSCCNTLCKLTPGSLCSDTNSECCTNCQQDTSGKRCRTTDRSSCYAEAFCTSQSVDCPASPPKENGTDCGFHGKCYNGVCQSYCQHNKMQDCACDGGNSCNLCCKTNDTICQPFGAITLPDFTPCSNGMCNKGVCEKVILNRTPRVWEIINHLKIDSLATFMRNNLVLACIILSAIPYSIICLVIWMSDRKKKVKEKKAIEWFNNKNDQLFPENYSTSKIKFASEIK